MIGGTEYFFLKTSDQAIISITTLTDIIGLTMPVEANSSFGFEAFVPFNLAGVLSGYKFGVNGPVSPATVWYSVHILHGVTGALANIGLLNALATALNGALASPGDHLAHIRGVLRNGVNAGTLAIQFGQNTSDPSAITVKTGAWLRIFALG